MKKFKDRNPNVDEIMDYLLKEAAKGPWIEECVLVCSSEGLDHFRKDVLKRTLGTVNLSIPEDVPVEISISGTVIMICVTHNLSDKEWIIS